MAFHAKHKFDAIKRQALMNSEDSNLIRTQRWQAQKIENKPGQIMMWSYANHGLTDIAYSHICAADPVLLAQATDIIISWAKLSLEREEWRSMTLPVGPDEPSFRFYGVTERHIKPRPEAWLYANLVLITNHWLQHNMLNLDVIASVLAKNIEGKLAIEGVHYCSDLLPLSAWPELLRLPSLPDNQGLKRKPKADDRIALMLAQDSAQLYDPKSPARKRARSHMRGSIAMWLDRGLSILAMNWLRTFEWREGQSGLSPREVMLRAYAYMPEVEAPANIAAEVASLRKIPI
jgi:hypothetical protein